MGTTMTEGEKGVTIGVISDTHGLLRPEVERIFAGCQQIIHAGDLGGKGVLERLSALAPVTAVRGNVDRDPWSASLPLTEVVRCGPHLAYLLHDLATLDLDPLAAGFRLVIHGHSHQPLVRKERGVLYLNPGSAGPIRFNLPVTVALLRLTGGVLRPEIVTL
ncbi:MAG TPA: metallophosphoesterase family protein [Geobacterales bacterium]|nr:metallophosphoesterase family protein [Geobacterales bacterium]